MTGSPAFYLGLETGGTKLVATLLDDALQCRATEECARPAEATARDTLDCLVEAGRRVQSAAGIGTGQLAAVGWGFGGMVDRRGNRPVCNFHEAGWDGVPATSTLAAALAAPVFVENDCKVAGLAEAHLGAGSPVGLTAYMTLGSGVGGGLIWNGHILASGPFGEAEIGHLPVVPNGARCACGAHGCLEAYCSGWGVGERAMEAIALAATRTPLMESLAAAEPRRRAELLFNAWPGDPFAQERVDAFLDHLATACATLCLLLSPSHLVIGGGIARQSWLAEALTPRLEKRLPALFAGQTRVRLARLGGMTVSTGAALYARYRKKESGP